MTFRRWTAIALTIVGVACVLCVTGTGCVSPFYGTAKIQKGLNISGGVGVNQFEMGSFIYSYLSTGPRADLEVGYAFNNVVKPYIRGGLGFGWRTEEPTGEDGGFPDRIEWLGDAAVGIQVAYPNRPLTPAIRLEVGTCLVSADMMVGIGNTEWLTLGMRVNVEPSFTPYLTIHPVRRLSIFVSPGTISSNQSGFVPYYSFGIGYSIK
jgi:hypothetical protein